MYSNMKYYENICNCLRVIQQNINRKLKSANCWQRTSLSRVVRLFAYAKTKKQIREADQRLCFRYIDSTTIYEISSLLSSCVVVQPGLCGTWSELQTLIANMRTSFWNDNLRTGQYAYVHTIVIVQLLKAYRT